MGKGRDKRRRKAKKKNQQATHANPPALNPGVGPSALGEPDALVLAPLKPKPHLRSGAVAIPEPEVEDELVIVSPRRFPS